MNGFDRTLHAQIASSSRVIDVLPIIVPAYRFNCKAPFLLRDGNSHVPEP